MVIYGSDSRRKLANFSPSQAQIGKYQFLVYVTGDECHVASKTFIIFPPHKIWFRPLMWVTVCPAQQQSPKQKKGENIPMTLLDLVIYHVNSEKS